MADIPALVVGDAMLDLYTDGPSTRQSPEAPVPVILAQDTRCALGGAANLAGNLAAFSSAVTYICLTGSDSARDEMRARAHQAGLKTDGFIVDDSRPTITKHRYLAQGRHVVRVDHEKTHPVHPAIRRALLEALEAALPAARIIVLSDYCKGLLDDALIRAIMDRAQARRIPVFVDSKRTDVSVFASAALIKPNLDELSRLSAMDTIHDDASLVRAARAVMAQAGMASALVSRAEDGVSLIDHETAHHFPATAQQVREVSGAGDTLLAVCALAHAAGADLAQAAWLGNIAAGLAVEQAATSVIGKEALTQAVLDLAKERQSA